MISKICLRLAFQWTQNTAGSGTVRALTTSRRNPTTPLNPDKPPPLKDRVTPQQKSDDYEPHFFTAPPGSAQRMPQATPLPPSSHFQSFFERYDLG